MWKCRWPVRDPGTEAGTEIVSDCLRHVRVGDVCAREVVTLRSDLLNAHARRIEASHRARVVLRRPGRRNRPRSTTPAGEWRA